jgi:tetratricopeptide (TPR) repeat protein
MLALYRCGRQADALNHYEAVRALLADELGTDPSPPLQQLHQQIITADPGLDLETAASRPAGAAAPRQLPRDLDDFTGRGTELDRLLKSVPILDGMNTAVVISAIDGMAGIGKTTLAIHAAHKLAGRYPDAHFYLDLHAHTIGQEPTDPTVALGTLLRSLGVPGERIPETLEERAALWRGELDDYRALVVLDNAASAAQVRPLLPGNPHCLVLITSRHRLTDLESAHTISVDALPVEDAVALFARVLDDDRALVAAESVREVVRLCGHLPLAIRIAAARLRSRPTWTIDRLIDRLRVGQQRLTELAVGDRSVAAVFGLSYRHLTAGQQRLFRLLGLHPGTEFDTYAAAALADVELDTAERLLEDLLDAHLVQQPTAARYRFHDLLHDYAVKRSADDVTETDRHAAKTRLLDYYRHAASLASDALVPQEKHLRPMTASNAAMPCFVDYDHALAWLDVERLNLLACATYATRHGRPAYACDLSAILWRYFDLRGHNADALSMNSQVLAVIADTGDRHLEGVVRGNLGIANLGIGRSAEAGVELRQALVLSRETGDRILEGRMLGNLGLVSWRLGRYEEGLAYLQQTLAFAQESGDISLEGRALHKLGVVLERLGRYDEALAHLESTLAVARDTGDRILEAEGYNGLGMVALSVNDPVQSLAHHQRALALARENGNHHQSALAHNGIGLAYHDLGHPQDARHHWQQAIDLYATFSESDAQGVRAQLEALDNPHLPV